MHLRRTYRLLAIVSSGKEEALRLKDERIHICVIPGDGIGREVIPAALEVLQATGIPLDLHFVDAGWECFQRTGAALPEQTLAAARAAHAVLFGAVASPSYPVAGYRSPIVGLRRALDLFANIRPVRESGQRSEANTLQRSIDLVVVRENTEGLYAGRERVEDGGDTAITERVITRRASERIVRKAFELARTRVQGSGEPEGGLKSAIRNPRPLVTIVHKANVLRETCGLFRQVALEVAQEYPDVACNELLVDTCALQIVQHPERFDVIVTTNLFGDILSDVAAYWGGGLGLATSANIGEQTALFEPVHGAAPDIAGQGIANPLAAIGCVAMLLEHQGTREQGNKGTRSQPNGVVGDLDIDQMLLWARRIQMAVEQVTTVGPHTPDLGGNATTAEVTQAVITLMKGIN